MQELPFGERSAKHILFHIFKQIVNYKKQDSSKGEVGYAIMCHAFDMTWHLIMCEVKYSTV